MMSEGFKKKVAYVTLGSFGSAVLFPVATDCLRGQLCSIEMPEMWHVEQHDPAPMQQMPGVVIMNSTSSSGGYSLTPGGATVI